MRSYRTAEPETRRLTKVMPDREKTSELRQKLQQLNKLEGELDAFQRVGHSTLNNKALIDSLRSNLPISVMVQHDRFRAKGRRSIADVRNGVCSGCHMALPAGTMAEVKRQLNLTRCDYCGRYLFPATS